MGYPPQGYPAAVGDNEVYGLLLSGTIAARPAAGIVDRYYWATDEHILYHDTGAAWEKAAVADHLDLDGVTADQHHPQLHAATHVSGGADDLGTITRHVTVHSLELGIPPSDYPTVNTYGITGALEFSDDWDKAYYLFHLPTDWKAGTDLLVHFNWTRSSTGVDDSGKTVKWQVKYLVVDGVSENCNFGEATLSIQDVYDSASLTDQIVYKTDDVTIPAAALAAGDLVILEVMAVHPTGMGLSEPALVGLGFSYTANLAPT